MEDFSNLIKPELLVLIPILYLIGNFFKQSTIVPDKLIPLYLGLLSIVLCGTRIFADLPHLTVPVILTATFSSVTQGIMVAATSVYAHQIYHQTTKK
ncbi:hypothetical protein CS063_15670 [Sporanaerobium hydrogeniformans]|uniref:Uncharacterized protein n=1 Tax=Sporanaerobium hydrogeniformans TaxID=3072179 RepID=A0AC61D774_9FIRM|nr:phage holin family protein [Sporanaerobium hydrogeniformans]PHV69436.1 hypothetical protein CS063_15670 [Sporanaerobium hydrogeniformans]